MFLWCKISKEKGFSVFFGNHNLVIFAVPPSFVFLSKLKIPKFYWSVCQILGWFMRKRFVASTGMYHSR